MAKILKGDVHQIRGFGNVDGDIWWTKPGLQAVRAAAVTTDVVTLGPFLSDADYQIIMRNGTYTVENLGNPAAQIPLPLGDFVQGDDEPISVSWDDITDKPDLVTGDGIASIVSISQADYDTLDPKDPATLYVING